jgi:hypothetical protein
MKRILCTIVAATTLLLATASPGLARGGHGGHFRHSGHVSVGFFVGAPLWGPGWWGPAYPSYPYHTPRTVIIRQQPETYSQQPQQAPKPAYWYFCTEPEGYYPYVKNCPKGWLKVVPTPTPEDATE